MFSPALMMNCGHTHTHTNIIIFQFCGMQSSFPSLPFFLVSMLVLGFCVVMVLELLSCGCRV